MSFTKERTGRIVSIEELPDIVKENDLKPKKESHRRREIARIGCELLCLTDDDVKFILNDKNDIFDVEMLFHRRRVS